MENKAAGAVIISNSKSELKTWVKEVLEESWPETHGSKYTQEFIIQELSKDLIVCFYVLTGYETQSENISFEHAFFVLDEFILDLEEAAPKREHLVLVDTGYEIEANEWFGFDSLDAGLNYFNLDLDTLRSLRTMIQKTGTVIWSQ